MGVLSLQQDDVLFAQDLPPSVNRQLQQAVSLYHDTDRAEQSLWQAHELAPDRLEVYIALYKFYFYKGRLEEAETVVYSALRVAAELGGFVSDWSLLDESSAPWTPAEGVVRFYLYSLKALAFIRLRLDDAAMAQQILAKLLQLDPEDQVGASVIVDLALAVEEGEHG